MSPFLLSQGQIPHLIHKPGVHVRALMFYYCHKLECGPAADFSFHLKVAKYTSGLKFCNLKMSCLSATA